MGRHKIKVIESEPLSRLIFLIYSGDNYAQKLSKVIGKIPTSTIPQLKRLEREGFISSKKEKLLNKTVYSVNLEKINKVFLEYLKRDALFLEFLKKNISFFSGIDKNLKNREVSKLLSKIFKIKGIPELLAEMFDYILIGFPKARLSLEKVFNIIKTAFMIIVINETEKNNSKRWKESYKLYYELFHQLGSHSLEFVAKKIIEELPLKNLLKKYRRKKKKN